VAAIAGVQKGRVSRWQLRVAGLTDEMIDSRVARGSLVVKHRGVFAVGHDADIEWGAEAAALLACGFDSVLSHWSGAVLLGILVPGQSDAVDVTVVRGAGRPRSGIRAHRSATLTAADVTTRHGLPVTTVERTLLDLADVLPERELERALDEALGKRLTSRTKVRELVSRAGQGRHGAATLERLLKRRESSVTRSQAEERLLTVLRAAGVPEPDRQVPLHGYEADLYWPLAGLVGSVDSIQWHSSPTARARDRRKRETFRAHGLEVVTIMWEQIAHEPLPLVASISRHLAERTLLRARRVA
jgi:very-short-patch-repair endonuclease